MRRLGAALFAVTVVIGGLAGPGNASNDPSPLRAEISSTEITLTNGLVERTWSRDPFRTLSVTDLRAGRTWGEAAPDFRLDLGPTAIDSTLLSATDVAVEEIEGPGLRIRIELTAPALQATRIVEVYEGITGFRSRTILEPITPLVLFGYTLDELAVGSAVTPTIHAFRAGADWRDPTRGWDGPRPEDSDQCRQFCPITSVGDPHAGTWRDSRSAAAGTALEGPAQWVSLADGETSAFMVMERNDQPSSRAGYDGTTASLEVDLSRDIVGLGPFEEQIHAENPTPAKARHRIVRPGEPFELEPSFVGFGSHPGDEAWQFHKYLVEHRAPAYEHAVTFNSNGTDEGRISTGAKDDMDYETVLDVAPKAKALGVDTFVLDDGWQANSGDWQPDCHDETTGEEHRDHRLLYPPRFPDCDFVAVREAIAPMKLGLWMTPMHFNPGSETYQAHPEWACAPVGHALAAYNSLDQDGGSNDAGIGTWSPAVIPHVEERIRDAIVNWEVVFFKFDFLVWLDCAGEGDFYDYREAFMAMVDRLHADHPHVTFQIDETNDYRLFPFESVARGPSWFQNGNPGPRHLLHNLWNLSPFVPAFSLGQGFLGNDSARAEHGIDTVMAAALLSYPTYFSDLSKLSDTEIAQARVWVDFYKANQDAFTHVVYPLLDDPVDNEWTALQSWDPERGEGALLAFRQESEDAVRTIALQNVPPDRSFDVFAAPTGEHVATVTSDQLTAGLEVDIPNKREARVLVIRPAQEVERVATTLTLDITGNGAKRSLVAALTDSTGAPVVGKPIEFFADGVAICRPAPVTDGSGIAACDPPPRLQGGPHEYSAMFTGDDDYFGSSDSRSV